MQLTTNRLRTFREAALHRGTVGSLATDRNSIHAAYRYPARFSPVFAAAAIELFSHPGDLVVDPFCGGGTAGIEATIRGRHVFSSDLSPLATFLARTKGARHSSQVLSEVRQWTASCVATPFRQLQAEIQVTTRDPGLFGALQQPEYRYIRVAIIAWEERIRGMRRGRDLARLVLLRCAQMTLDLKRGVPSLDQLRAALEKACDNTLLASSRFAELLERSWPDRSHARVYECRNAAIQDIDKESTLADRKARLALFSPPYPGVHVLYPRWQLRGRRESPVPFFISGVTGSTHETAYTMGRRGVHRTDEFISMYQEGLRALSAVLEPGAFVIQMIGFKDEGEQLSRVLRALQHVGYRERRFRSIATAPDGRLWREVPGQRWYNAVRTTTTTSSREVVLVHEYRG